MSQPEGPPTARSPSHFLTLPDEDLLFVKKKHWINLVIPLSFQIGLGVLFIALLYIFLIYFIFQPLLFIMSSATVILCVISLMAKTLVDWYFHFYTITTRKIVEYCCLPLFSHTINEILLDQVRCTEIDVRTEGIINQLINKGDVTITFNRPTHQEEMLISDIYNPQETGTRLADIFDLLKTDTSKERHWYRSKEAPRRMYFTDGISENYKGGLQ